MFIILLYNCLASCLYTNQDQRTLFIVLIYITATLKVKAALLGRIFVLMMLLQKTATDFEPLLGCVQNHWSWIIKYDVFTDG